MAKEVTVLGLEGSSLRGMSLNADGETPVRGAVGCWPLLEEISSEGTDSAAQAAEDAVVAAETELEVPSEPLLTQALSAAVDQFNTREFTLSLPLSKLLVKTVWLPVESRDDLVTAAQDALAEISPFPDEVLLPGVEIVAETDTQLVVVVAALTEAAAAEVGEALEAAKVQVVRTDATAFGWLRGLWPRICERQDVSRRIVLLNLDSGWDLILLEDGVPVYMRGLGLTENAVELGREVMLSLFQSGKDEGGFGEVVVCTREPLAGDVEDRLSDFAPVRMVLIEDDEAGVEGVAFRSVEGATLDVTPDAWREARAEARFRRGMIRWMSVAIGFWALIVASLWGSVKTYDVLTANRKNDCKNPKHQKAFKDVKAMTNSVALVERYRDHAHGALEILKTVSDTMPDSGMTLKSFSYRRGDSVRVRGEADDRTIYRNFQNGLQKAQFDDDERLFTGVTSQSNDREQKQGGFPMDLVCSFKPVEEPEPPKKGGAK